MQGLPEAATAARVVSDNGVLWRANIAISTVNNGTERFGAIARRVV